MDIQKKDSETVKGFQGRLTIILALQVGQWRYKSHRISSNHTGTIVESAVWAGAGFDTQEYVDKSNKETDSPYEDKAKERAHNMYKE